MHEKCPAWNADGEEGAGHFQPKELLVSAAQQQERHLWQTKPAK